MDRRLNLRLLAILLLAALPWGVSAADPGEITGVASVIDGDTIDIHGTRIRLHGIDAPESKQLCLDGVGKEWRCGQKAALALADRIGRSPVSCEKQDMDRYGRVVGQCSVGGTDVNAWLVAQGWAVAYQQYSRDYVGQEDEARAAGRGIWGGRFVMPWDWRRGQRIVQPPPAGQSGDGCKIKGNIGSKGERIYHVPGGRFYNRTRIDESSGEHWFCNEAEAQAAGWRRSHQ